MLARLGQRVLLLRSWGYMLVAVTAAAGAVVWSHGRMVALVVLALGAIGIPRSSRLRHLSRVEAALGIDALATIVLWWLFGPVAGLDFILFFVASAAPLLLARRAATRLVVVAVGAELAQIPLHFVAKAIGLPGFHAPAQVQTDAQFLVGVAMRSGYILGAFALFVTIAVALQQAQRARERSESLYRELYEEAPNAYFSVGTDGMIQMVNRKACELLGYPLHGLVGRSVLELYAPGEAGTDRAKTVMSRFLAGDTIHGEELQMQRADGERIWIGLTVGAVRDHLGSIVASRSVVEDISDRKAAEEQLRDLVRAKDEFIATVSHELRTPLTTVLGFSEILMDEAPMSTHERNAAIEAIRDEAFDLEHIVEDLLVAGRAEVGNLQVTPEAIDVGSVVSQVLESDPRLGPSTTVGGDVHAEAVGDPSRVRQIVRNLLQNALRYGGDRTRVDIETRRGAVALCVSDNGRGIDPDDLATIFDPYQRANQTPGLTASVGLGLTVSRRLARLMGGDLTYRRTESWTVFEFTLPTRGLEQAA